MGKHSTREVAVTVRGRGTIFATWPGGAYVDLTFGMARNPTEVINVYDYAAGTYDTRVQTPSGLQAVVREWVTEQDREARNVASLLGTPVNDWFGTYVENARY